MARLVGASNPTPDDPKPAPGDIEKWNAWLKTEDYAAVRYRADRGCCSSGLCDGCSYGQPGANLDPRWKLERSYRHWPFRWVIWERMGDGFYMLYSKHFFYNRACNVYMQVMGRTEIHL